MSYSSEEETDLSEPELEEYADRCYKELKNGKEKVKVLDELFRCPYCPSKKKQDYSYKDLLQHASGVGKGLHSRDLRKKGMHLGLVRYMEEGLGQQGLSAQSMMETTEPPQDRDVNELFVWPWMGIVANVPHYWKDGRYVSESGSRLREDLTGRGFNPVRVHPLWNHRGFSGYAIVEFNRDWPGFNKAMLFEKSYEANRRGKRDYYAAKHTRDGLYGWVAREDDFNTNGIIGEHLRKTGDMKSISEIEAEEKRKTTKLVSNLTNVIDVKNQRLKEIECKYNETFISLNNLMTEKDKMHQAYNEEIRKMQKSAREQLEKTFKEHEKITFHLEGQKRELEEHEKELGKREAYNENERRKLYLEKQMNEKATLEQKKANEKVLRLAEDQKSEKEKLHKRILELEKKLDAKQALELEIERMRGALLVMKHMGEDGDMEIEDKMHNIQKNLKEKEEELEDLEALNQALVVKERKSNDELQEARKELIDALKEQQSSRALIGVKRIGELDNKPFHDFAKRKFSKKEADEKAVELCSQWEDYLRDPSWHPFKVVMIEGGKDHKRIASYPCRKCSRLFYSSSINFIFINIWLTSLYHLTVCAKEIIDEEDEKLKELKNDFGDEVYMAVIAALVEMNEYNPSGRYIIPELWNYQYERKAKLKEVVSYILKQWTVHKRRKN
ncbi:unnamed protein product [Ilex paraguariensis]|uniref:XH/XS domain-containing protein n=1 Tax=Ilex paraguariensis TaxID=185542 RepID=A0ABC8V4G6_9AQUA